MFNILTGKIQFKLAPDKDGTGDSTTEDSTDNTDKSEEKTLADTMYSDSDKKDEEAKDDAGDDEKKDEEVVDDKDESKDESKDEAKDDDKEKDDADGITYEDFTVPEGFDEVSDAAKELFKDSNLSQEDAQKFVDYGAKIQQDTIDALKESGKAQQKEWGDIVDKDLKAELPKAIKFVNAHLSDETCTFLEQSGLGNHPEMVKLMSDLADFSGEDFMAKETTSVVTDKPKTLAETMYPGQA